MPRKRAADLMLNSSGGVPASIAASDRGRGRSVLFVNEEGLLVWSTHISVIYSYLRTLCKSLCCPKCSIARHT